MSSRDYAAEDCTTSQDMLVYVDLMSELLANIIERAINLKDRVEDLGCFITDASGPTTDREINEHRDKLKEMRERYPHLF